MLITSGVLEGYVIGTWTLSIGQLGPKQFCIMAHVVDGYKIQTCTSCLEEEKLLLILPTSPMLKVDESTGWKKMQKGKFNLG